MMKTALRKNRARRVERIEQSAPPLRLGTVAAGVERSGAPLDPLHAATTGQELGVALSDHALGSPPVPAGTDVPGAAVRLSREPGRTLQAAAGLETLRGLLRGRPAGEKLPDDVRRSLEPALGERLDEVRLHTDSDSARATDLLGARALAVGRDVFFGPGEYDPDSTEGWRLLAHELAHTAQARGREADPSGPLRVEPATSGTEHAAEDFARQAAATGWSGLDGVSSLRTPGLEGLSGHAVTNAKEGPVPVYRAARYTGEPLDLSKDEEAAKQVQKLYDPKLPAAERTAVNNYFLKIAKETHNGAAAFAAIEGIHYTGIKNEVQVEDRIEGTTKTQQGVNYANVVSPERAQYQQETLDTGDNTNLFKTGIVCNQAAEMLTQAAYGKANTPGALVGNQGNWRYLQTRDALTDDFSLAAQGDMIFYWSNTDEVSRSDYDTEVAAVDKKLTDQKEAFGKLPAAVQGVLLVLRPLVEKDAGLREWFATNVQAIAEAETVKDLKTPPPTKIARGLKAAWSSLHAVAAQIVKLKAEEQAQVVEYGRKEKAEYDRLAGKSEDKIPTKWAGKDKLWVIDASVDNTGPYALDKSGRIKEGGWASANHVEIVFDHKPGPDEPAASISVVGSRSSAAANGIARTKASMKKVKRKGETEEHEELSGGAISYTPIANFQGKSGKVCKLGRTALVLGERRYIKWPQALLGSQVMYEYETEKYTHYEGKTVSVPNTAEARKLVGPPPVVKKGRKAKLATMDMATFGKAPRLKELMGVFAGLDAAKKTLKPLLAALKGNADLATAFFAKYDPQPTDPPPTDGAPAVDLKKVDKYGAGFKAVDATVKAAFRTLLAEGGSLDPLKFVVSDAIAKSRDYPDWKVSKFKSG